MKRATDPDAILLQAAADPTRLAILRQLAASREPVCACDFTACCDVAQPTVSHHLKVLRETGWVTSERRASFVYYSLAPMAVDRFREIAGGLAGGLKFLPASPVPASPVPASPVPASPVPGPASPVPASGPRRVTVRAWGPGSRRPRRP